LEQYELALKDAENCIRLRQNWVKGYFRKGKALIGLKQYQEAIAALKQGLKLEANKELQEALKQAYALY
jgi:stress-induced-phosphoprotein 1